VVDFKEMKVSSPGFKCDAYTQTYFKNKKVCSVKIKNLSIIFPLEI